MFDKTHENLLRSIYLINTLSYSLFDYCIDNKLSNIVIYTEEQDWFFAESMLASFYVNENMYPLIKKIVSKKPFSKVIGSSASILPIAILKSILLDGSSVEANDIVIKLTLSNDYSTDQFLGIEKDIRILHLPDIINSMGQYILPVRPIYHYINTHPRVTVIGVKLPLFPSDTSQQSKNEMKIWSQSIDRFDWINAIKRKEKLTESFDGLAYDIFSSEFGDMLNIPASYIKDGIKLYQDYSSLYMNIAEGRRITNEQPSIFDRTIFISGGCTVFGAHTSDEGTIASVMQKKCNELSSERIRVENYGVYAEGRYGHAYDMMQSIPAKDKDIVVIWENLPANINMPILDLSQLFIRPHNYGEVFTDRATFTGHFNDRGYKVIAEKILEFIKANDFFNNYKHDNPENILRNNNYWGIPDKYINKGLPNCFGEGQLQTELREYKSSLKNIRDAILEPVGAIVMNCNPFTLGHRYLIEYAACRVRHLFIFAVEEDKSIFPFKDRLDLIKQGTADIKNITVLPSGKFIISSLTFTEYFNKSEIQDIIIDSTQDVEIFAQEIAPVLGITIRFAGEEPMDNVTKQYNDTMKKILPQHGITFEEIPRKESDGEVISASRVRKLLASGDYKAIQKLVPYTTLTHLKKMIIENDKIYLPLTYANNEKNRKIRDYALKLFGGIDSKIYKFLKNIFLLITNKKYRREKK